MWARGIECFGFVSLLGHSRSVFCHCVSARSRVRSAARSPVHVCFVVLHAVRVSIGCVHSCFILCCVAHRLCISLAACFHVVMSCVNTWLMSFLISCVFVSCFAHGWWIVCWPCACVFVLCEHVASVLVFCVPCALMSFVLTPPILLPVYWLIFPSCSPSLPSSFAPFIISLCLQSCASSSSFHPECILFLPRRALSCLAKPASCPVFPLRGSFFVVSVLFFIKYVAHFLHFESSPHSFTPTLTLVIALACCCSFVGFECFYNFLICKSLWIKAFAKWLNK